MIESQQTFINKLVLKKIILLKRKRFIFLVSVIIYSNKNLFFN